MSSKTGGPNTLVPVSDSEHVIKLIDDSVNTDSSCLSTMDVACQTDPQPDINESELNSICTNMTESLKVFQSFMKETQSQISSIKDEIASIKNCVNVGNSQLNGRLDSISSKNTTSNTETKQTLHAMQRRLQSVQDFLRRMPIQRWRVSKFISLRQTRINRAISAA